MIRALRPLVIIGIALILGGLLVIFRGVPYSSERQIMKIGDLEASVEEKHTVPAWLGVVAIVGGVLAIAAGQRSRTTRDPDSNAPLA